MKTVALERVSAQTLLGIRFWDPVIGQAVAEGLAVRLQRLRADPAQPARPPRLRAGRAVAGRVTDDGIVAFFGVWREERPPDDPARQIPAAWPPPETFAVDVWDARARYLPMSFTMQAPIGAVGPFRGEGAGLATPLMRPIPAAGSGRGAHLWSAPGRPIPPGFASVIAQVVVGENAGAPPAAYALVEITDGAGYDRFALADARGVIALPLPYPPAPDPDLAAPPPPLYNQTFPLSIRIFYRQQDQITLPGSEVPELGTLLTQPAANIGIRWTAAGNGAPAALDMAPALAVSLEYGRPLILRTANDAFVDAGRRGAFLRIQPQP